MTYTWIRSDVNENKFIASFFKNLIRPGEIFLFQKNNLRNQAAVEGSEKVLEKVLEDKPWTRMQFDGIMTMLVNIGSTPVAIIYNDFKISGGSFGSEASKRLCAFLKSCQELNYPVLFFFNTIGVRIMEGRKVFPEAFSVIPALKNFAKDNLLITCTTGRCLGIGALLYALGDYRFALEDQTVLNLTGPEVFKMFFGNKLNYQEISSAGRQKEKTGLIQEILKDKQQIFQRIKDLLNPQFSYDLISNSQEPEDLNPFDIKFLTLIEDIAGGLGQVAEVFPQQKNSMRAFIVATESKSFGVFINPPGRPNMIDVSTIEKYQATLKLFRKLQLPIVSHVETSGGDPRVEQNDNNIIGKLTDLAGDIIDYPFTKIGVVGERCFGGASVLSIPFIFGGEKVIALEGARVGIMHNTIIRSLLSGTPRFLAEWEKNAAEEKDDLQDFIDLGIISKVIPQHQLRKQLLLTLFPDVQPTLKKNKSDERFENPLARVKENTINQQINQKVSNGTVLDLIQRKL